MPELSSAFRLMVGLLVLILGFGFHWLGQLLVVVDWKRAVRLGLVEKDMPPEYKVYEHAFAVADASLGWLYGVVAVGLIFDRSWAYALAWIPGFMFTYHAIGAWVWEGNRRKAGHGLWSDTLRNGWCAANLVTGLLTLLLAVAEL